MAPKKRLRILGAPRTAFSINPPAYLKDALAAHAKRDYALAATLAQKELDKGKIPGKDLPMVQHFVESVQIIQKSIEHDLAYTLDLIEKGELYLASLEYPQLKMIVDPDNEDLKTIATAVESDAGKQKVAAALAAAKKAEMAARKKAGEAKAAASQARKTNPNWADDNERVVTLLKDGKATFGTSKRSKVDSFPQEEWALWKLSVLESPGHAPKDWMSPGFDDSAWETTKLPVVWHPGHTGLLRSSFEVKDKDAFSGLQVRAITYKLKDLKIYLNGDLVAHINGMNKQHAFPLTDYAMSKLKNGKNDIAIFADHGARYVDFSFRMEGRLKQAKTTED